MRVRRGQLALGLAVGFSVLVAMSGSSVAADNGTASVPRFAKIDRSLYAPDGNVSNFVPASLSSRPVSAVIQLADDPVAVVDANAHKHGQSLSDSDKQSVRQRIKGRQDALRGSLSASGAQVVGQMQDAYNGIQVVVPQKNLPQVAALSGVVAIHALPSFNVDNERGVPFIGGPEAWATGTGLTGDGVNVGIIDTGIDYTHADFGGPGTVAAWDDAFAHSTAAPSASLVGPAAPKVKGGFDFVGDNYNANVPGSVPVPDPNPLDCFGHGSHTAGTLAGFGVLDGATFTGPYTASTISSHAGHWSVGPGVAPKASLFVYRVFGCNGSSNVVDLAINQAVKDHVNVISMSLGSPLGGTDDPTSVAAQNAFDDGITVVASAGNEGPSGYMVGSPSTDNGVLSVAAIDASFKNFPAAAMALSTGTTINALDANDFALPSGSFPIHVLRTKPGGPVSLGCNPAEYVPFKGDIVVTVRGTCARVARAVFGDEAGVAAVVMINNVPGLPPFEGNITSNPDTGIPHVVHIPFLGVTGPLTSADATALVNADGGSATLTAITIPNTNYAKAASFSSGGPRNPDSAPKPDVMAPGVSVFSAGMGTGFEAATISGTSMACPMTAGVAALLKQEHPSWTGVQIKAAIMNTADPTLNVGYNSRIAGTGVVQAQNAVNSDVIATTSESLDSIAFGYVPGTGAYHADKTFTLTNYSPTAATYDLSVALNNNPLGAAIGVSPSTVAVPALGGTATVHATLTISAAAFATLPSVDTGVVGPGGVVTVRGDIVASRDASDSAADHQTLSVPFMLVPRGLSNVVAGAPGKFKAVAGSSSTPGHDFSAPLTITNNGIHTGTADLYAWGISDPRETGAPMDVRDVGLQVQPGAVFGVPDSDRGLVFLINTWGQAANQSVNEFDIPIDTNGDGVADFVVVGADLGFVLTGTYNGVLASFTIDAHTGALVDIWLADAPMNGSTVELPLLASDLGISPNGNGTGKKKGITYQVAAFSIVPGGMVDVTGAATIDPYAPSVSSGDLVSIDHGSSATFTLTYHIPEQNHMPALGWLVASVDDANGAAQAAEVAAPK